MFTIVDVSSYQDHVSWSRVAQSGVRLAFIKATEGANYVNPRFKSQRHEANAAGLRIGCYHFARPEHNRPEHEARHFCAVIGQLGRRDLRPVLDLEVGDPAHTEGWARAFNQQVKRELGSIPILYSYSDYLQRMRLKYPIGAGLWLASYGRNDGVDHGADVPRPWKKWIAHQFTSRGHVAGIPGEVDVSHAPRLLPLLAHPVKGLAL